jgi:AcrR family transcriptional regulator
VSSDSTELFAEQGYAAVTVRQIAAAAGVSPAPVIHHYGSKEQLRAAIDERVAAFVESMLAALAETPGEGGSASGAELFAVQVEREPAMAAYIRRLLADGSPAGISLFERLYQATQIVMRALSQAGVVRPADDERVRNAFLLANDLAMILLRPRRVNPGTAVTVVRPAALVGGAVDTLLTRHFEAPRLLVVRGCAPRWQFCHVDDLVSALELAVAGTVAGDFAVGCDGSLSQAEVEALSGLKSVELPARLTFSAAQRLHRLA